jgi:mono/diheme cytochrome c family protein
MAAARAIGIASVLIGLTASGPVAAQDIATGERLARQYCVRCHRIAEDQQNTTLGRSFHVVSADTLELTTKSLMERLNGGHFILPAPRFSEEEARAVGDFIAAQR